MFENKLRLVFGWLTISVLFFSRFLDNFKEYLPDFLSKPLKYGKFATETERYVWVNFEIPKSWYRHFYLHSCVVNIYAFVTAARFYLWGVDPPVWLMDCLDFFGGYDRNATVNEANTLLAIGMITVQILRRFYESYFVSVFSANSRMNVYHFVLAIVHYTGLILAMLIEAPGFAKSAGKPRLNMSDLTSLDYAAVVLFAWAWKHQKNTTAILGNLRKGSKGEVVTDKYLIPQGDWFEYFSSPHFIAEILMYFSIAVVLYGNFTWTLVFIWVLSNQGYFAWASHLWYKACFKDYPKERKILIPFVY